MRFEKVEKREYTGEEVEDLAWAGGELPEDMGYGDQMYFLMLRALYAFARTSQMDMEQGKREKARVQAACKKWLLDEQYAIFLGQLQIRTEAARTAYRKERTQENADKLLEVLDNVAAGVDSRSW